MENNIERAGKIFDSQHKKLQKSLESQDNHKLSKRQITNRIKKYKKLTLASYKLKNVDIKPHFEYSNHESLIKMFLNAEEVHEKGKFNNISNFYKGFCFIIDTPFEEKEKENIFEFLKQYYHKFNNNLFFIAIEESINIYIPNFKENKITSIPIEIFLSNKVYTKQKTETKSLNDINFNEFHSEKYNDILNIAYYLKEYQIKTILFTYGNIYKIDLIKGLFYILGVNRFGIVGCKEIQFIVDTIGEFKRLAPLKFKK